jgi:hypothetical protein
MGVGVSLGVSVGVSAGSGVPVEVAGGRDALGVTVAVSDGERGASLDGDRQAVSPRRRVRKIVFFNRIQ